MQATEAQCRIHPQQPLGRVLGSPQHFVQQIQLGQDAARMIQENLALRGQVHAAGRAIDQGHTDPRFDLSEALADRRGTDAELPSGAAQAAATRDGGEEPQFGWLNSGAHGA